MNTLESPLNAMESALLDPAIGYVIILGIALLFALAGADKLRGLAQFSETFAAYRVLPDAWGRRLAWLVPCVELAIAITLPWESSRHWAMTAAMALLIAYASALGLNLARGRRDLDCGCGTAGNHRPIAAWMVWRNLLLVLALGIAGVPWVARPFNGFDLLTVFGGLAAVVTLYATIDLLLGEVAPQAMSLSRRTR
jgi:hypothetical protein